MSMVLWNWVISTLHKQARSPSSRWTQPTYKLATNFHGHPSKPLFLMRHNFWKISTHLGCSLLCRKIVEWETRLAYVVVEKKPWKNTPAPVKLNHLPSTADHLWSAPATYPFCIHVWYIYQHENHKNQPFMWEKNIPVPWMVWAR